MTRRTAVILKVVRLMKKQWQRIILAVLIAQSLLLATDCLGNYSAMLHSGEIMDLLKLIAGAESAAALQQAEAMLSKLLSAPDVQARLWLSLAALLITPVLTMGLYNFLVLMLKDPAEGEGVEGDVRYPLSRFRDCLKALGCTLLVALRVLLATLPGAALYVGLLLLALQTQSAMIATLSLAGFGLSLVMGIRTAFLYVLAQVRLAENTREGIRAALNASKTLMEGHRWEYFTCQLNWYWLSLLVAFAAGWITSTAISLTLSMVASVVVSALIETTTAAFYLVREAEMRGGQPEKAILAEPADGPDPLN